jgi:hypothetical protein
MDTPMHLTIDNVLRWQMIEKLYNMWMPIWQTKRMLFESGNNGIDLPLIGPCIVMYSYNKTNQMHQFLKLFIFA